MKTKKAIQMNGFTILSVLGYYPQIRTQAITANTKIV
jgi:hypothetical protein